MSTIEKQDKAPIAIVGMASLFAQSEDLGAYWDLIRNKIDAIIDVPASRWQIDDYYDADKSAADKVYCRRGGFLPDIDFDPMEYGLPPNILELTDTSQLLSLVVAKDALIDAGLDEASAEQRNKIGVVLGVGGGQKINHSLNARLHYPVLKKVLLNSGVSEADATMVVEKFKSQYVHWEENSFPGSLGNVIAGRIANRFDLGGMNCVVDAACAGSLAATKMALSELWEGRADVMITGGVCTDNSPQMYMSFSKTPAFTENSVVQPFDQDSKGMMIGEGIGMVVLKRLSDAERDGDRIYAVVKGIGTSSDGKFKSIYAPRPEGQAKALNRAYADAGFAPHTVGLIEAHGTGTAAGDVAEFEGLRQVFAKDNPVKQGIALGSVKSQIGHTKSTAGTAGFIKAALALHHKVLPPTINVNQPNPKLNISESPFYINSETRPWIKGAHPRRAGISSFGFGGTNYHVALEEYTCEHEQAYRLYRAGASVLFKADDRNLLIDELSRVSNQVKQGELELAELLSQYAVQPVATNQARLGLFIDLNQDVAKQLQLALTALQTHQAKAWQQDNAFYREQGENVSGKVVALYSGQGSQYVNMGQSIAQNYPEYRNVLAQFDALLTEQGQASLSSKVMPIPVFNASDKKAQAAALQDTRFAQPAIGALSWSLHKLMQQAGFSADFCAGHSFGELTALAASGVISESDYLSLCVARGSAMAATPADQDSGAMMAVVFKGQTGDELAANTQALTDFIEQSDQLWFANYNSPTQIVVAGTSQAIDDALVALKAKGIKGVKLPVSAAFHTPLVEFAQGPYAKAIEAVKFSPAKTVLSANSTGKNHAKAAAKIKQSYQQHMLSSVRFTDQLNDLYAQGARIFVEFGPKNILSRLVQETLTATDVVSIALNGNSDCSDKQLQLAHLQLAVLGLPLTQLDKYALAPKAKPSKAKSPLTIKLGGQNYLSEATKSNMQQALANGQISQSEPKTIEVVKEVVKEVIKEVPVAVSESANAPVTAQSAPAATINPIADAILAQQQALSQSMAQYQQQSMALQQQFLEQQAQLSHRLLDTLSGQAPVSSPAIAPVAQVQVTAPVAVPVSEPAFIAPEPKMPTAYPVNVPAAPVASSPAPVAPSTSGLNSGLTSGLTLAEIEQTMLNVVADKTGYPTNMLELSMDMEADLGIDSIKRVEILGTVQDQLPTLPTLNPEDLAELRTLGEIVNYMQAQLGDVVPASVAQTANVETANTSSTSLDLTTIQQTMLSVVADKTGYPANMLELSMDMEADLGIDSIKRVEILGTVQDQLPSLPALNPEDLAELRTLGEIVSYMQAQLGDVATAPVSTANNVSANTNTVSGASLDLATIQQTMLSVVADKTGYPANMLELSMDMEADLGIDSIKRVEILGTVQDQLPSLPALNPEDLAELRTLGEIVSYMQAQLGDTAPAQVMTKNDSSLDLATIQQTMLTVVADKTGYPANMLELSMDMEADLGIDSIKRVEILGTVQDQLPSLPALNPEDLAELRTLGEIVSYMQAQLGDVADAPVSTANTNEDSNLDLATIEQTMLTVVADKTGYPANMLELTMDMEADLGIDSIKRVEILGTVQDQLPSLPALNPEDLAELRTLGEIVAYMQAQLGDESGAAATSDAEITEPAKETSVPFQYALMTPLAAPKQAELSAHQGEVILLTDDGHNTGRVAEKLLSKGLTPVVISFAKETVKASSALNSQIERITLADNSETSISELCQQVVANYANITGFVHLQPSDFVSAQFAKPSQQVLQGVFLFAKHLKATLAKAGARFICVVRGDGGLGYNSGLANAELMQMGLAGLCKTLKQEWPHTLCRVIDIDSALVGSEFARSLTAELFDQDVNLSEVAINATGRFTLVAHPAEAAVPSATPAVTPSDVFIVSGGAKGVTNACVVALAKGSQAKFVLLGRSEPIAIPQWATGLTEASELQQAAMVYCQQQGQKPTPASLKKMIQPVLSQLEIDAGIAAIEQAGGIAEYVAADVTDAAAMARVVEQTKMTLGPITGLIHGAGVLADGLIENKKLSDFERVFATKIEGLHALLNALAGSELKHIALFSSAAGFYGNKGQSDYAIANEILNKTALALAKQQPQAQVFSFNWGPWDGGMVTPELKRMFEQRGVYVIPIEGGAQLFADHLLSTTSDTNKVQVIVGTDMSGTKEDSAAKKPLVQQANLTHKSEGLLHAAPALNAQYLKEQYLNEQYLNKEYSEAKVIAKQGFLRDHQINGNPVLPTVFATGWMAQAAQRWLTSWLVTDMCDYQLFKGVVLSKEHASAQLQLTLEVIEVQTDEITLQARISSEQQGRQVFHYGAKLTLRQQMPFESVNKAQLASWQAQKGSALASTWYQDGTLFHQNHFCMLKQCISLDEQQGVFIAELDPCEADYFADFDGLHGGDELCKEISGSALLADDLLYQTMLVWAKAKLGKASLPVAAAKVRYYQRPIAGQAMYVVIDKVQANRNELIANVALVDESGQLLVQMEQGKVVLTQVLGEKANTKQAVTSLD
ncbi:type I polyketide synthase [Motilimonas eburnea]|uniref:type I polyketide synthase n=1 Tax=Motilimonas eburnea TaxID=1737488 RepID=UPI001E4B23AA|nr:type I polyketide synthase [Motilimonas eburnea]MCE2570416.1 SDR family NAD(P)-dependent oxidoreductase [Motilimonas eburnea]